MTAVARRTVLGAAGVGISSLALPAAAEAASTVFTTGLGDDALVMYLDATNASSWSGSGNWTDLTGNNRSLTPGGPMSFSTDGGLGITGGTGAFVFDGSGGVAPNGTALDVAYGADAAWSITAWVRFSSLTGWQTLVGHGDDGSNAVYFQKAADGLAEESGGPGSTTRGDNRLGVAFGGKGDRPVVFAYGSAKAVENRWYHVAVTATPAEVRVHLDGAVVATATTGSPYGSGLVTPPGTVRTLIGNRFDGGGDPLRGALAFLQIWTRALSDAEVAAQYAATRAPYHPS